MADEGAQSTRFYVRKPGLLGMSNLVLDVRRATRTVTRSAFEGCSQRTREQCAIFKEKTSKLKYEMPWSMFQVRGSMITIA